MTDTGRAGRTRLERRLVTARRGAHLLDRKQRILADELVRLELQAARTRAEWDALAREAAVWLRRTAALDGRERLEAAAVDGARAVVRWDGAMGVAYPEDSRCELPAPAPPGGSSALSHAVAAHRAALAAGVEHAAVQRAVLLVSVELAATRTRHRAVENRWIPRLEDALTAIRRQLDAQELEESLRLRWAADTAAQKAGAP